MFTNNRNGSSGVITVFLSLLLVPLLAFGSLVAEVGRYRSAKNLLAEAQISASMSILADYNAYLRDRFGLLVIDPDSPGTSHEAEFKSVLLYNSDNADKVNAASRLYEVTEVEFETIYALSDFNVLKRQVLEASKYSVPYTIVSESLNLESLVQGLVDNFTSKLGIDGLLSKLDSMEKETEESVSALDEAFTHLGRVEHYGFELSNFLGADKEVNDYTPIMLYTKYILNDYDFNVGSLTSFHDTWGTLNYSGRYNEFITAINDKEGFIAENPDPAPDLNEAKNYYNSLPSNNANVTKLKSIYAILMYLEDHEASRDDFDLGTKVRVSYSVTNYSYDVDSNSVTAGKTTNKNENITVSKAISNLSGSKETEKSILSYDDLYKFVRGYMDNSNLINDYQFSTAVSQYKNKVSNYYSSNNKKDSASDLVAEQQEEKNDWDSEIGRYNSTIEQKKNAYMTALSEASSYVSSYSGAIDEAIGKLNAAKEEYKNGIVQEQDSNNPEITESTSNSEGILEEIDKTISSLDSIKGTLAGCTNDINAATGNLAVINASSMNSVYLSNGAQIVNGNVIVAYSPEHLRGKVNTNYGFISEFCNTSPIKGGDGGAYEGGNSQLLNALDQKFNFSTLWSSIQTILKTLTPVPYTSDPELNATISAQSASILPTYADAQINSEDQFYVETLLDGVKEKLGEGYENIANSLGNGSEDGLSFSQSVKNLQSSLDELVESAKGLFTANILEIISALKDMLEAIGNALDAFKDLINSLISLFKNFLTQSYYTLLINTYITQNFPSRMTPVAEALVNTGNAPDNASYFKGACIEYIFGGKASENENQATVYWLIFGIRAVVNCFQVLSDSTLMSIVSACNLLGILVFIALVYYETTIDMNYLVRLGKGVDLWKSYPHLSLNGLKDVVGDLIDLENLADLGKKFWRTTTGDGKKFHKESCMTIVRTKRNNKETEEMLLLLLLQQEYTPCGLCKPLEDNEDDSDNDSNSSNKKVDISMTYDKYLWVMLLFVGEEKKLERLGNLIQLETRYYESTTSTANFLLDKAGTYVRSKVTAQYTSVLPLFSLGGNTNSFSEWSNLEYVGY